MRKTNNYGLALYDKEDKMIITAEENSLNANMKIIDKTLKEKATETYVNNKIAEAQFGGTDGNGLKPNVKNLLITLFRSALYNSDQTANIMALEQEFSNTEDDNIIKYTITNNLTNVTTNNGIGLVIENSSYTAILSANNGYVLENVTVTMANVDITSNVYSNGVINIINVTGNIVITANAIQSETGGDINDSYPTNGLMDLFDFRNATPTINTSSGSTSFNSTEGDGAIFAWSADTFIESNDYGSYWGRTFLYDSNGGTKQSELGTQYTVITLGYTSGDYGYSYSVGMSANNLAMVTLQPKYKNTSGSQSNTSMKQYGDRTGGYHMFATVVDEKIMRQYVDGVLAATWNGDDYEDFTSWEDKTGMNNSQSASGLGSNVAMLVYNRAITEVELKEIQAYLKTLEVA